jgi:purine-binding chemotaxis protein CheW
MNKHAIHSDSFVLFELAGTFYGIPSQLVQQMEMIEHITPVPNTPAFVEGVVFVRGQVVPAMNLRRRFGFEAAPHTLRTRLVVVSQGGRSVGLVVDSAREFVAIPPDSIQPVPEAISGMSGKYLHGISTLGDRLIMIVNVEELLRFDHAALPSHDSA